MLKSCSSAIVFGVALILLVSGCGKQLDYGYAPQFTLPDVNGVSVSLSDFKDKVLIIDFWTTWCSGCVAEIPHFIELQEEYEEQGFEIITISLDEGGAADVKNFLKKKPLKVNYTMLIGNQGISTGYKTKGILPTTFVVDRTGKIRRKYVGYQKKAVLEKEIKALLSEPKETPEANK